MPSPIVGPQNVKQQNPWDIAPLSLKMIFNLYYTVSGVYIFGLNLLIFYTLVMVYVKQIFFSLLGVLQNNNATTIALLIKKTHTQTVVPKQKLYLNAHCKQISQGG